MSDRGNALPEAPENWGEYSRMLGDLPLRSLPSGAEARLRARLDAGIATPRPRRPWLVGSLSVAGAAVAVLAGMSVFAPHEPPAAIAPMPHPVVTESRTKHRTARRPQPARPIAPQLSETPVPIDTNIPPHIPIEQRGPEVTTGGDRRGERATTTAPGAQPRPRPEGRSAP